MPKLCPRYQQAQFDTLRRIKYHQNIHHQGRVFHDTNSKVARFERRSCHFSRKVVPNITEAPYKPTHHVTLVPRFLNRGTPLLRAATLYIHDPFPL